MGGVIPSTYRRTVTPKQDLNLHVPNFCPKKQLDYRQVHPTIATQPYSYLFLTFILLPISCQLLPIIIQLRQEQIEILPLVCIKNKKEISIQLQNKSGKQTKIIKKMEKESRKAKGKKIACNQKNFLTWFKQLPKSRWDTTSLGVQLSELEKVTHIFSKNQSKERSIPNINQHLSICPHIFHIYPYIFHIYLSRYISYQTR